ncbi:AbrB family transcriptional regulator [Advenella sp. RU8]|uniref:AbrB family transcriptional regulator n=1 Tax=Advenella sp. RU8 TaxID=3399575 RepID=UPI003AACBF36
MFVRYLTGFILALSGALAAVWLAIPLPWLIGSLLLTAITKTAGVKSASHTVFRNMGQWVIGTSLGLYFTPEVLTIIGGYFPFIFAGMVFAILLGINGSLILKKWGAVDFKTAWFASAIGGASEMANLAERNHARTDLVASAHSLRMIMVVISIPFAFKFLNISGNFPGTELLYFFDPSGFFKLVILTCIAGLLFKKFKLPNPWVLGPLLVTILLTGNDTILTYLPNEISKLGQLFIGWSLGDKFGPDFFKKAPRYLSVVALSNTLNLILAFGFSYLLSTLSDIPFPTLVLSNSPGGITEMSITAKVLSLGAPIVTAFHVARMVFVLLVTSPLYHFFEKYLKPRASIKSQTD